eukprot:TRINITY_DN8505_c0_g2_i2.p1 TRINITY_DN8505_c0_g2~~TRINITY_DN8505_c0_g2_i2.p1  ORF type:complete len:618 (-),score=45.44 TRINITY_DN8505_c0_g2_i2:295-2148(-)
MGRVTDLQIGPLGYLYLVLPTATIANSTIVTYSTRSNLSETYLRSTLQNPLIPQVLAWATCPSLVPIPGQNDDGDDNSSYDSTPLIVGIIVPVGVVLCFCCLFLILVIVLLIIFRKVIGGRLRTYREGDEEEGMEMKARKGIGSHEPGTFREVDPSDIILGAFLGEGAYGKVYKGLWRGAEVAIKTFDQIDLAQADESLLNEIKREAGMMQKLGNHPNIIGFIGAVTEPGSGKLCILTDYCPNGSLYDYLIKSKRRVAPYTFFRICRDIAAAILHLHKENMVHRDIAARNVLVGANQAVFLGDFGLARVLIDDQDAGHTQANTGPIRWMAPECMLRREYSPASDCFAYGVTLWELVTRKQPWAGLEPSQVILAVTQRNMRLQIPVDCDPVLKHIIKAVWRTNPAKRPSMARIVERLTQYCEKLELLFEDSYDDSDSESRHGSKSQINPRSGSASSMLSHDRGTDDVSYCILDGENVRSRTKKPGHNGFQPPSKQRFNARGGENESGAGGRGESDVISPSFLTSEQSGIPLDSPRNMNSSSSTSDERDSNSKKNNKNDESTSESSSSDTESTDDGSEQDNSQGPVLQAQFKLLANSPGMSMLPQHQRAEAKASASLKL